MEESSEFHYSPECPLLMLHTQRAEEDLLLFVVPKAHQTATLNRYLRDAGHQGCDCTLSCTTRMLLVARNGQPDETIY